MAGRSGGLPDMSGKTILVTGASSGIGRVAARRLAAAGATVLVHGRSPERTARIAGEVGTRPLVADYARLENVRALAESVLALTTRLDIVMHNAGALVGHRTETPDGHELTFQTNHLAPFLMQRLLEPLIVATARSRIIVVASKANRRGHVDLDDLDSRKGRYHPLRVYSTTKLENILFVRELSHRLAGTGTHSVAVHPGDVATAFGAGSLFPGIFYRIPIKRLYLIAPEQGAEPLVHLAGMPDPGSVDGLYYDRLEPRGKTARQADDPELARSLWERSEEMLRPWLEPRLAAGPAG
jgi:NAD(P)-dependent dehydrogenase (short-subunit alcohol dehydrogenase family)